MIERIAFKAWHLDQMDMNSVFISRVDPITFEQSVEAHTWMDFENMKIIASVGALEMLPGVMTMWAFMSDASGPSFIHIHRFCTGWFERTEAARFEATVKDGFAAGHRWLTMLGFYPETKAAMRKWDGVDDYWQYARVPA